MKKYAYKKPVLILIILSLLLIMPACGKSNASLDTAMLAHILLSQNEYEDQLSPISENAFYALYGIDPDNDYLDEFLVYVSTGATAEEIAILTATEKSEIKVLVEAVNERIESQIEGFENYIPKEIDKLKHPVLVTEGKYVILCISNNNEKANKLIGEFLE